MPEKIPKKQMHFATLLYLFTLISLAVMILMAAATVYILLRLGIMREGNRILILAIIVVGSLAIGSALSRLVAGKLISSIVSTSKATKEIAKGNFDVKIDENVLSSELKDMAQSFNIMAKELSGTEMMRNDFVENVSHEFKTPLSAIEGYATLLQKKDLPNEKRIDYTKKILYNTKRLSTLTGDILLLSRLENQELGIEKKMFCLDEQLREIILSQEENWSAKNIALEIELESVDFYGNKELIAHVWQNIFSNAIKFSPEFGIININLKKSDNYIYVNIKDNGSGMNSETKKRIFEKFYQGDRSRSSKGNGLGLTLAKRVTDLHHGKIEVVSEEGKGSEFSVILPITKK